jgi:DNA polymerase delta subunit 1
MIRLFERAQIDFRDMFTQEVMTYESNIAYTLRFMVDTKVSALSYMLTS